MCSVVQERVLRSATKLMPQSQLNLSSMNMGHLTSENSDV
jgi:hypothetical protein